MRRGSAAATVPRATATATMIALATAGHAPIWASSRSRPCAGATQSGTIASVGKHQNRQEHVPDAAELRASEPLDVRQPIGQVERRRREAHGEIGDEPRPAQGDPAEKGQGRVEGIGVDLGADRAVVEDLVNDEIDERRHERREQTCHSSLQ